VSNKDSEESITPLPYKVYARVAVIESDMTMVKENIKSLHDQMDEVVLRPSLTKEHVEYLSQWIDRKAKSEEKWAARKEKVTGTFAGWLVLTALAGVTHAFTGIGNVVWDRVLSIFSHK
jgi:hypothetical protein